MNVLLRTPTVLLTSYLSPSLFIYKMNWRGWNQISILWRATRSPPMACTDFLSIQWYKLPQYNNKATDSSYRHLSWILSCVCLPFLCVVFHCKYLLYFDNYIKMKAMFVAIYLYSFLLCFISVESINKNVFSFKQLTLKTLIFEKTCKGICYLYDLLKEDKWGVKKKYLSACYHELKRENMSTGIYVKNAGELWFYYSRSISNK